MIPNAQIARTARFKEIAMSSPETHPSHDEHQYPADGVEAIVPMMPIVLPVIGGLLMLLLAFIAVYMT